MDVNSVFQKATAGLLDIPADWMSATATRPLVAEDNAQVWLRYHGDKYGLKKDSGPYDWLSFIAKLGNAFEAEAIERMFADAIRVCPTSTQVRQPQYFYQALEMMAAGVPVMTQVPLWYAPERIYGTVDIMVRKSHLIKVLPHLAAALGSDTPDYYIVIDCKFASDLEKSERKLDFAMNAAQVRLYTYMLGQIQGLMPPVTYLITKDNPYRPVPVKVTSQLGRPLDGDLAAMRDVFAQIKVHGGSYVPWKDRIVAPNYHNKKDQPWIGAKKIIARDLHPGGHMSQLHYCGKHACAHLGDNGFNSLEDLLQVEPSDIPLEDIPWMRDREVPLMRALLQANRTGVPVLPLATALPPWPKFNFYVDYEFFSSVRADFKKQWPKLEGCEMIFMVGVGFIYQGQWVFKHFTAEAETQEAELKMMLEFLAYLKQITGGQHLNPKATVLKHWTHAERSQTRGMCDRHALPENHPLRRLPWFDLHEAFAYSAGAALPGAWRFGLKPTCQALAKLDPQYDPHWPADLKDGLTAQVMGWAAYQQENPFSSLEMQLITQYLPCDCNGLYQVDRWMINNHR